MLSYFLQVIDISLVYNVRKSAHSRNKAAAYDL